MQQSLGHSFEFEIINLMIINALLLDCYSLVQTLSPKI